MLFKTQNLVFGEFLHYKDIDIEKNKTTFLIGKSGSGKTTLFRLFNNTLSPSSGTIFYNDHDIDKLDSLSLRRNVLLVSQDTFLFNGTIKDNFNTFFNYREISSPSDELIKEALSGCELPLPLTKDVVDFSGGERQRLFLAIMLLMPFKTLMLDEPTSALDSTTSISVINYIIKFCKKTEKNLLIISHSGELEKKFSEQTINLER